VSRAARLLVIDPSIAYPEDEGTATILAGWAGEADVRQPALRGDGPGPGFGYDFDGVVLMGSKASVDDGHPWLRTLCEWLDPLLDGRRPVPLFGICFGHQLIAHRAGGTIGPVHLDRHHLLGETSSVLEGSRLLPGRSELRVVASHYEEVKSLPGGFRVTARRSCVPVDGLEHEELPVFGFQFHPEARGAFLESRGCGPACVSGGAAADGDRLMRAFFELVRRSASVGTARKT
jgi:GMP synthase-like glutamine amidotransferase